MKAYTTASWAKWLRTIVLMSCPCYGAPLIIKSNTPARHLLWSAGVAGSALLSFTLTCAHSSRLLAPCHQALRPVAVPTGLCNSIWFCFLFGTYVLCPRRTIACTTQRTNASTSSSLPTTSSWGSVSSSRGSRRTPIRQVQMIRKSEIRNWDSQFRISRMLKIEPILRNLESQIQRNFLFQLFHKNIMFGPKLIILSKKYEFRLQKLWFSLNITNF